MAARKDTPAPVDETVIAPDAETASTEEAVAVEEEAVGVEEPVAEEAATDPALDAAEVADSSPVEEVMDENMPWPTETGTPNTFGVDPGLQLGCPQLGSVDGAAAQVNRLLGLGDGIIFNDSTQTAVAALQDSVGLEPSGVVDLQTWAHILPELQVGSPASPEIGLLRGLLGLARAGEYDSEVEGLVRMLQAEMAVDRTGAVGHHEWAELLGVAL